jgi:hypothetical protein
MTRVKVDGVGAEDVLRYWFGELDAQLGRCAAGALV